MNLGLSSADMIVMNEIVMETYPAYDDGTPNTTCILGHPEPNSESGSPRLIKIKYITAKSKDPILFLLTFYENTAAFFRMSICAQIQSSVVLPLFLLYMSQVFLSHVPFKRSARICQHEHFATLICCILYHFPGKLRHIIHISMAIANKKNFHCFPSPTNYF